MPTCANLHKPNPQQIRVSPKNSQKIGCSSAQARQNNTSLGPTSTLCRHRRPWQAAVYTIFMEDSTRTKESFRNAAEFHGLKVNVFDAKTSSFQTPGKGPGRLEAGPNKGSFCILYACVIWFVQPCSAYRIYLPYHPRSS